MSIIRAAPILLVVLIACGQPPSPGSGATATASPAPTVAASAPATASPTPTVRPSPVVSSKGGITVKEPALGDQITTPLTISGEATVFEGTLVWRIVDASGKVLAEGTTTASAGAPQKGTFKVSASFETPYYGGSGTVEVFERSPKDGAISDIAKVPVGIQGAY